MSEEFPETITDFIDFVKMIENKGKDYTITFSNVFTLKRYILRIHKALFDLIYENREIVDLTPELLDVNTKKEDTTVI